MVLAICVYLTAIIVVCVVVRILLEKRRLSRLTSNIPNSTGELPVIGHVKKFLQADLLSFFVGMGEEANQHEGLIKVWLGSKLIIGITNPKIIKPFANVCLEKSYFYSFAANYLGEGLLLSSGKTWKHHRKTLNTMFHDKVIEGFMQIFNNSSIRFVESLKVKEGKGEFNHWPHISNTSLEIANQTFLGSSQNDQITDNSRFATVLDQIAKIFGIRLQNVLLHPQMLYNLTKIKRNFEKYVAIAQNVTRHAYNLKRSKNKTFDHVSLDISGKRFKSILDLMLDAEDKGLFTKQDVVEELDNIIAAGYDTTAHTLMFLLLTIGTYPEVQEKLVKEIKEVFGESPRAVAMADLGKLVYMDAVIQETLRMLSVVPLVARTVTKTVKIGDFIFPSGSEVVILLHGTNKQSFWGDPKVFRPERFLNKDPENDVTKMFYPFSSGRRNCIGKMYAMTSMKTLLCHVLWKYKVNANMDNLKLIFNVVLKPTSGFHISVEPRQSSD